MRDVAPIWDAWQSGRYLGDTRPCTRVTVEPSWQLQTTESTLGTWNRGPARWFQDDDHDYSKEVEIPNIHSVNISRGTDADAGSCDIVLTNVIMPALGDPESPVGQFGNLGGLTWDHGAAQDARARWQHVPNQWANVLVPNALLRTYQGFGGHDKTIPDAITDGNLVLNGVWLVDDITIATDGTISIKCRDMAKLLIDQQLFPPLVPLPEYPLVYNRWDIRTIAIPPDTGDAGVCYASSYGFWDSMFAQIFNTAAIWHSSTDEYYGELNTAATGHQPSEAFDMSYEQADAVQAVTPGFFKHQWSYWLSEPCGASTDWVWIEFTIEGGTSKPINSIYFHPWAGNYYVQVSVFENGEWTAPQTTDGGTTPHGIPFVGTFVTNWEGGQPPGLDTNIRPLPRTYHASRVRLTITNLAAAPEGGYRAGARKIMACYDPGIAFGSLVFAGGSIPVNNDNPQRIGYWQLRYNGNVYAFGDARTYPANSNGPTGPVVAMAVHPTGEGYWLLDVNGRVTSHGQANWFGDLASAGRTDVIDIAPHHSGNGYWLLTKQGTVHPYGAAGFYGNSTHTATMPTGVPALARSIESHPSIEGYWVAWSDGHIDAHNLTHHGNATDRTGFTEGEYITTIRRTSTGAGYWVLSGGGHVQAFGDATDLGDAPASIGQPPNEWYKYLTWDIIGSSHDDAGYAILHANGVISPVGDPITFTYGSVGEGSMRQRFDGNYKDYTDIIRELLLWSGFYLHKDPQPEAEMPDVFGNLETTGAWSDEKLPVDMFDKRPVLDAIKQIRDIVGYQFFIDAEGGARFESPNWWALGNYLIDGTPYPRVPEIDEAVQLLTHNVIRSGTQARSRLIIANSNPMPTEAGKPPAKDVITTEITPRTASDLRGLCVPAMWVNHAFMKPQEQKVMAELIDLRSWFARRTATVTCVANPLIDINDQVRVIERQTGEVYVHYVRGISISHDLGTGSFTMDLTTHWLGGSPYGVNQRFRAGDTRPQLDGHWLATFGGYTSDWGETQSGVYAFGNAQLYDRNEDDSHLDVIVALRSTRTGNGYYTLDRRGKVLTYGDAVHHGDRTSTVADIADMALTPTGNGYWLVQEDGTVLTYGDAVHHGDADTSGLFNGQNGHVEALESHPGTMGYWILLSNGQVQAFNVAHHGNANRDRLTPTEYFTALRRTESGDGYWILSGGAVVKGFGDAPEHGDGTLYPAEQWVNGLTWIMIPGPDDSYLIVHSDGASEPFEFPHRTEIGPQDRASVWSIVTNDTRETHPQPNSVFGVSAELQRFLLNTGSQAAVNAATSGFDTPQEPTIKALP